MAELQLVRANQQNDHELVARLRAGDWSALDGFYHRYALPVYQRSWRILRERQASWQVTHDTFAAFLAHLPIRAPRQWLFDTCAQLSCQAKERGERR